MNRDEIKAIFDQMAANYDTQWKKTAPIRDGLHFLLGALFANLPTKATVLCVGAGTGEEIAYLAKRFPQWRFAAVEPSGAMLDVCRQKAEKEGFASRCYFHEGYLDTLPSTDKFDAATSFLVSHFILEKEARSEFFQQIARRLKPSGILASADLSADVDSEVYEALFPVWQRATTPANVSREKLEQMRNTYAKDVAILPPTAVASIMMSAGFEKPVQFYQAGLIHAWFATYRVGKVQPEEVENGYA